jgi:hypothetical protein
MIKVDFSLSSFQTKRMGYVLEKVFFFLAAVLNSLIGLEFVQDCIPMGDIVVSLFLTGLAVIYLNSKRIKY